jgi:hypothetical protein
MGRAMLPTDVLRGMYTLWYVGGTNRRWTTWMKTIVSIVTARFPTSPIHILEMEITPLQSHGADVHNGPNPTARTTIA